jgi:hypothetical protein
MSRDIITAIRQQSQLHGSLLLAAIELAHRADGNNGIVQISYSYLASKIHQSRRTAIRHINRLINLGIIRGVLNDLWELSHPHLSLFPV